MCRADHNWSLPASQLQSAPLYSSVTVNPHAPFRCKWVPTETFATIEEANEFREEAKAIQLKHRLAYQAWSRHVTRDDLRQLGTILLKTVTDAREKKADACHVLIEPCPDVVACGQLVHKKQKRLLELC